LFINSGAKVQTIFETTKYFMLIDVKWIDLFISC
jgi:hypothetical protein